MRHVALFVTMFLTGAAVAPPVVTADEPPQKTGSAAATAPAAADPLGEPTDKVVFLRQNWTGDERARFYSTPQGSQIIPYDWFLKLEQAGSQVLFRDARNIMKYRYLPQPPGSGNPDGLPIGFVADPGVGRRWLGMTCAACHTAEVRFGTTAYRVDGAPTHADVQEFLADLTYSLRRTFEDPQKFARFAQAVLKGRDTPANRELLRAQVALSLKAREGYNLRNFPGYVPGQPPTPPAAYGRLDAVGAIVNEVFHHTLPAARRADPTANTRPADAPVSYPCLWDTPQHDLVEWIGIAKSGGPLDVLALSRNVGEALGVFGDFVIPEDSSLFRVGYPSSVKVMNLRELEDLLKGLWSPLWPDDFPAIDRDAAEKGAALYQANCVQCHALIDRKSPRRTVKAKMRAVETDPRAADNFFKRTGSAGLLTGANVNFVPFTERIPEVASADQMVTHVVAGVILGQAQPAPPDELSFRGNLPRAAALAQLSPQAKYKARPLNGIWATAPYLHNGSVPNLDALLRPAARRPAAFAIGTRTFDPVRVGYVTDAPGFPQFRVAHPDGTPIVGNSNAGHEYGTTLGEDERRQLIEYLKTL